MCSSAHESTVVRSQLDAEAGTGSNHGSAQTTRRGAIRLAAGSTALALLASGLRHPAAVAQQATPAPTVPKEGLYVVVRSRTVRADASIDELNAAVGEDLVPLIQAIPGFVEYYVVQNPDTRERTAITIFTDKAGADESTAVARDFLTGQGLADSYESVEPVILEGRIVVAST